MRNQEPGFGPDMRNIEFRATRERQQAAGPEQPDISVDEATGDWRLSARAADRAMAHFRRRWRWMALVQVVLVACGTGWVLFTQYVPTMPIATPIS